MSIGQLHSSFDATIFYYWLAEEQIENIFSGEHMWWFAHGLAHKTCVFYGPTITQARIFNKGPIKIVTIPTKLIGWSLLREFLWMQQIAKNPILSIVVEDGTIPEPGNVAMSLLPVHCLVADTHHRSNPITSSIFYMLEIRPVMISVSHSPHRKIISDCLSVPVEPLAYTPRLSSGNHNKTNAKSNKRVTYYGTIFDPYHPERSHTLKTILNSAQAENLLLCKPRMEPSGWHESLSKDMATLTCSINGFPSTQSYVPLIYATCLITDQLSSRSDLGAHLVHEENCLVYKNEQEALELLRRANTDIQYIQKIGIAGNRLLHEIAPKRSERLLNYKNQIDNYSLYMKKQINFYEIEEASKDAITVSYAYEIIQEVHRLSRKLHVSIIGIGALSELSKDYLEILPRLAIHNECVTNEIETANAKNFCLIHVGKDNGFREGNDWIVTGGFCIYLRSMVVADNDQEMTKLQTIHPSLLIQPDYEGASFEQQFPLNLCIFNNDQAIKLKTLLNALIPNLFCETQSVKR